MWPIVLLSILLQSFSFLSLKYASQHHGTSMLALLALAGSFLVARAFVWNAALGRSDMSRIYPFTGLFQILVFLYAVLLFHEIVQPHDIIGLALMIGGLVLVARDPR